MPIIFDNISQHLLPQLKDALQAAYRADFCVGYFNLRGWKELDPLVVPWIGGEGNCVRLLVGMQRLPQDELRSLYRISGSVEEIDNQTAIRLKRKLATWFPNLPALHTLGNLDLLRLPLTALFCSRKCPGDAILKAYDLARELREKETPVISGFHTPVEKDMLEILHKGNGPIVICPARGLEGMKIVEKIQKALIADRLLICTISPASVKHITKGTSKNLNRLVACLSNEKMFI